jgi:hypothetical protein
VKLSGKVGASKFEFLLVSRALQLVYLIVTLIPIFGLSNPKLADVRQIYLPNPRENQIVKIEIHHDSE